jgi:hypothetical protein
MLQRSCSQQGCADVSGEWLLEECLASAVELVLLGWGPPGRASSASTSTAVVANSALGSRWSLQLQVLPTRLCIACQPTRMPD